MGADTPATRLPDSEVERVSGARKAYKIIALGKWAGFPEIDKICRPI
jgi:hypothetical protein